MMMRRVEQRFESLLFGSRWLAAPLYLGLVFALLMLLVVFVRKMVQFVPRLLEFEVDEVMLATMAFIDVVLVANLVLIVILAGYENFVSRIDIDDHRDRPSWMRQIGFSGLKLKLFASMVAITGIELLKAFLAVEQPHPTSVETLRWMIGVHLTFVVTTIGSAFTDWLTARASANGH
jgi:uncharacterized protein (TIGR00645 family)